MSRKMSAMFFLFLGLLLILQSAEKYAILLTADLTVDKSAKGIEDQESDVYTWDDTFLMWKMLINKGYDDNNIYVVFAEGDDPWILSNFYHYLYTHNSR